MKVRAYMKNAYLPKMLIFPRTSWNSAHKLSDIFPFQYGQVQYSVYHQSGLRVYYWLSVTFIILNVIKCKD